MASRIASASQHRFYKEERHSHSFSMTALVGHLGRTYRNGKPRKPGPLGVPCPDCHMRVPNLEGHQCPVRRLQQCKR